MAASDANYKLLLDRIAQTHLVPDAGQKMDVVVRSQIRDRIMRWVSGPEILEMGAGELMWTSEIVATFGHSSIVDGSGHLLQNAKAIYGEQVTCYECLFEEFTPPGRAQFQTVIATHVLEHVPDPVQVLRRSREWLVPGGRVIVVVPNATSLHRRLGVKLGMLKTVYDFSERDYLVGHQRIYDLATLKSHAQEAGFRITHVQGFFLKILPVSMMTDFSPALVKALFEVGDEIPAEMSSDIGLVLTEP